MEPQPSVYLKALLVVTILIIDSSALIQTSNDEFPITFLDCAGSSLLAKLGQSQEELTVYSSIPEVRLKVSRNILEDINQMHNGDHLEYLRMNQYVIKDEPLYGEVLRQSEIRQFLQIYKVEDSNSLVTCGGCVYHALAENGLSEYKCPSDDIEVMVPTECHRTMFHIDWIEPQTVNGEQEYVKRTDVKRDGPAPGDGFTPGVHRVTYYSDDSSFSNCSFTVRVKDVCPYDDNVRTIIGAMAFNDTLVGNNTTSINRNCPSFRGSNAALPRATAECIYDPQRGPVWKEPADLTDCLVGKTIEERFEIIQMLLTDVKARDNVSLSETVEIGLAVDAFSRLEVDEEDAELLANRTSILLKGLIELNLTSDEITNIVLSVVDNFFDREREDDSDDTASSLNSIVFSLERQAENQIQSGANYTGVEENVALLNVVVGEGDSNLVSLSFGNFRATSGASDNNVLQNLQEQNLRVVAGRIDEPRNDVLTSVSLPQDIERYVAGEALMVSFLLYRDGSLFPTSDVVGGAVEEGVTQVVGSQVVAATVYNLTDMAPVFKDNDQLITTFTPIDVADEDEELLPNRICAFWNFTKGGFWSTKGCSLANTTTPSRIQCQCKHATSFAVLVNVKEQAKIFTWISQLGCAVSTFALLITILSILSIKNLRQKTTHQVHVSLMVALLGLYMVFLFGADQTQDERVCIGVTAAIHYFLLSSFVWMFMEGILLYKIIVATNASGKLPRFIWYASFIAWVLPILPVIAPFIMRQVIPELEMEDFYELNSYCFLRPDSLMMYIGLLGFMATILAFNLVIFILIIRRLLCRGNDTSKGDKRKFIFTFVSIVILFGLTWSIGFFAIRDASFGVSIAFSILNAFQGFFMFLIFGVREREVRKFWSSPCLVVTGRGRGSSTGTTGSTKKSRRSGGSSGVGRDNPTLEADSSTHG